MKKIFIRTAVILFFFMLIFNGCEGSTDFLSKEPMPLQVEEVNLEDLPAGNNSGINDEGIFQNIPDSSSNGLHPIFSSKLGVPINKSSLLDVKPDPTGLNALYDYDGDGIPNDEEVMTNEYISDYPRIVTRISTPITMELRKSETLTSENYTETIEDTDVKETITNCMEEKHYDQFNKKTTPIPTKESQSTDDSFSFSKENENTFESNFNVSAAVFSTALNIKTTNRNNYSIANSHAQSTMSERTEFEDVDYSDNLDRNGVEYKNETIQNMTKNFRQSEKTKETYEIGPEAGFVRAGLYIKNVTLDMPVKISNVICTLTFKTSAGTILPIKTFRLRNEDYSEFEEEIYGGEELGPYTIEVKNLNTNEVKHALRFGYIPQIHIISYEMRRVKDSNYNPGSDNLKIVEETAKSRTATIKIIGTSTRELYRVTAFDIEPDGSISPGLSLKKALFRILYSRVGDGESWDRDNEDNPLTVEDSGLKWKSGFEPADPETPNEYNWNTDNLEGNKWRLFETYIKRYTDEYNQVHRIETIKRIGNLAKYNPFSTIDNPDYNPNEFMERDEVLKMKYWIILHNGKYFEGDINDPIWAGERYEIICIDLRDFNEYFQKYYYSPVQTMEYFSLNTSWNRINNEGEFARAKYLGRILKNDIIHLELNLAESRFLFDRNINPYAGAGDPYIAYNENSEKTAYDWYHFNYTHQQPSEPPQGIPGAFSHTVEGGFNTLKVDIEDSNNARGYEVSFKEAANTADQWKSVYFSTDELEQNDGILYITRKSKDKSGNEVGIIEGAPYADGGLEYYVNVKAIGVAHDVNVTKDSMTNNSPYASEIKFPETIATVYSVGDDTMPAGSNGFTYSVFASDNNWINVRIPESNYTEYYSIYILGPYNYPNGDTMPPLDDYTVPVSYEIIGHPGLNRIKISNPTGEVTESGVYKLMVFAQNNNSVFNIQNMQLADNGEEWLLVELDRFEDQRKDIYFPRKSQALFNKDAIDLEVNFNDGSGWYRLKMESTDYGDKVIDCRYTSNIDYDNQKFHIYFKAPAGLDDIYDDIDYDVFAGGKEEVGLYIRTVAEPRYRDTFWMKNQNGSAVFSNSMNYITTGTDIKDIIDFWSDSDLTDASFFEDNVLKYAVDDAFLPAPDEFGIKGNDKDNFFFSPVEYRDYDVKVRLEEAMPVPSVNFLDTPKYEVQAGDRSIDFKNIKSIYSNEFWLCVQPVVNPDENFIVDLEDPRTWQYTQLISADSKSKYHGTVLDLPPYSYYKVAVVGTSTLGNKAYFSKPSFWDGRFGTSKPHNNEGICMAEAVFVATQVPTDMAPSMSLSTEINSIQVSDVSVHNEVRYYIEWKEEQESWANASRFDSYSIYGILPPGTPVEYTITHHHNQPLKSWKLYDVRAAAVTLAPEHAVGPYNEVQVETARDENFTSGTLEWIDFSDNGIDYYAVLNIDNIQVPPGTVSYTINGNATILYDDIIGILYGWLPIHRSRTVTIDSFDNPVGNLLYIHKVLIFVQSSLVNVEVWYTVTAINEDGDSVTSPQYHYTIDHP